MSNTNSEDSGAAAVAVSILAMLVETTVVVDIVLTDALALMRVCGVMLLGKSGGVFTMAI